MNMIDYGESQEKAKILMEALPYVRQFRGSIFVVKYGGSFMDSPDPHVRSGVAKDLVFLHFVGIKVVVVHGGGKAISRELERKGIEPKFIDGLRVTDLKSIEVVDQVLNQNVNREVSNFVAEYDCEVERLPGKSLLGCEKIKSQHDLGFVGEINAIDDKKILDALDKGKMPILSSTATDKTGQCYNINADSAAAEVAIALGARRLVYLSDVPGLLKDPAQPTSLLSSLACSEVKPLKEKGVISAGMLPKVNSAVHAINSGVNRVHFIDGRLPHSILLEIFTDQGIGTEIVKG